MTDERKRQRRRQEFRRLTEWLDRLYREHRWRFHLLTFAVTLVILGLAILLRWILEPR
jgi:hypothetical protein